MDLAEALSFLASYLLLTIKIAAISTVTTVLVATFLAICRLSPWRWIRIAARVETDVVRSIPLLALLLFLYFGVGPYLTFMGDSSFWLAVLALTLSESSYISEVYRAALESIPAQQWDAAGSIGLSWWQTVVYVMLPQAVTAGLPATVNLIVAIIKDSSLASLIAVNELTMGATILVSNTFLTMEVYLLVTVIYFVLVVPIAYFAQFSEGWVARRIGLAPLKEVVPGIVETVPGGPGSA